MKRLFLALNLPDEVKSELNSVILNNAVLYPKIKWCEAKTLHLTLHFLGDVDEEKIPQINLVMQSFTGKFNEFKFGLDGIGYFPNPGQARIIFLDCQQLGSKSVAKFQQLLGQKLTKLNFVIDQRPWHPHITIGRMKEYCPIDNQRLKNEVAQIGINNFSIRTYELMESTLTVEGPNYKEITSCKL